MLSHLHAYSSFVIQSFFQKHTGIHFFLYCSNQEFETEHRKGYLSEDVVVK